MHGIVGLLRNQFLSGGLILMITGSLIALLRNLPVIIWDKIVKQFMVQVTIHDRDPLFEWVTSWIGKHPYSRRARSIFATTQIDSEERDGNSAGWNPRIIFSPAHGQHFFFYKGKLIWLRREKEEKDGTPSSGQKQDGFMSLLKANEVYVFRTPGRTQEPIRELIRDVLEVTRKDRDSKISVYVSSYCSWRKLYSYSARPLKSIILPAGLKESICDSISSFIKDKAWYEKRGVPYRVGLLFHGPPGNGKTSTVEAVAGHLGLNLYCLNLSTRQVGDSDLANLVQDIRKNSILLLEDIDAAFTARQQNTPEVASGSPSGTVPGDASEPRGVTLSGLLNVLDGVLSPEGLIVVMTTNYPERLDSALVRPGRVDKSIKFEDASRDQRVRSFEWFYPEQNHGTADKFADSFGVDTVSMAKVQEKLMAMRFNEGVTGRE